MKCRQLLFLLTLCATLIYSPAEAKRRHRHGHHRHSAHSEDDESRTSEPCPNGEFAKRMRMTNYYTPVMSAIKCKNGRLGLINNRGGDACSPETIKGVVKRMEGAATIISAGGQFEGVLVSPAGPLAEIKNSGVSFNDEPPIGTPEGMYHVVVPQCPLGYGSKINGEPVCLDPFKTIACPPHHPIGEVAFIPAAVDIKYPRHAGQSKAEYERLPGHDGYFVCGDIGDMIQGEHVDLFIAFINPYAPENPFIKFSSTRKYGVCWAPKDADQDRERRYKFHIATEMNRNFPYLDAWTHTTYANNRYLAQAFGMRWYKEIELGQIYAPDRDKESALLIRPK